MHIIIISELISELISWYPNKLTFVLLLLGGRYGQLVSSCPFASRVCSPLASSPPPPSATPSVAFFQPCGEASQPYQQHATSTPWCMGPASVDAMLTFPRPLLCCCSCFRPPGTAPVQVCGSGLPLPSPLHTPSIGMCAMYIVMRRGAHGRAYACTGVCMGLASQQAASEAR